MCLHSGAALRAEERHRQISSAPELSYHDRYGLISGEGASSENAESGDITVE